MRTVRMRASDMSAWISRNCVRRMDWTMCCVSPMVRPATITLPTSGRAMRPSRSTVRLRRSATPPQSSIDRASPDRAHSRDPLANPWEGGRSCQFHPRKRFLQTVRGLRDVRIPVRTNQTAKEHSRKDLVSAGKPVLLVLVVAVEQQCLRWAEHSPRVVGQKDG